MQSKIKKLSNWSMFLSLLCAIHCAAMPILIASISLMGVGFLMNPFWENVLLVVSAILAIIALFSSYNKHKNWLPIGLFAFGLLFIVPGILVHSHLLTALGSMISAASLFYNWRVNQACKHKQVC